MVKQSAMELINPKKINKITKLLICCLLVVSIFSQNEQSFASDIFPQRKYEHKNIFKKKIAETLSNWTIKTLETSGVKAAIVSRPGTKFVRCLDKTGMGHTGIVMKDPKFKEWMVYNLFSNPLKKHRFYEIRRTTVYDFFYSQPSLKLNALLLIPSIDVQDNVIKEFVSGKNKELIKERKYNLISSSENFESSNCTEWVVLNILAARENTYDPSKLIKIASKEILVKPIKLNFLSRLILAFTPNAFKDELSNDNYIKTFMAYDLYNSNLLKRFFTETVSNQKLCLLLRAISKVCLYNS